MKVVKSINEELVYEEIDPKNYKQFKKAGWTEVKEPVRFVEMEYNEPVENYEKVDTDMYKITELPVEAKELVNKGGRPKKTK